MTVAAMALGRAGQDTYHVYKKKTRHSTRLGGYRSQVAKPKIILLVCLTGVPRLSPIS